MGENRKTDYRTLSKLEVLGVFKKHAAFHRDMNYNSFVDSLDSLADSYFNEEYDEINPSLNASNRPL